MVTVPFEVTEFLRGFGNTLLVKGAAGTGKTTFSLGLLCMFPGVYVSTRVSKDNLIEQYPWLLESVTEDCIIDATRTSIQKPTVNIISAPDEYFKLPKPLKTAYERIERLESPSVAIFDSWDALIGRFELSEKKYERGLWKSGEIEALLLDAFSGLDTNIVLVTERTGETQIDYIVDAIVSLQSGLLNCKQFRQVELAKIRGVRIEQPRYLFTLMGGMYRSFPRLGATPLYWRRPEKVVRPEPILDTSERTISTGIRDFDKVLDGGFVKGSVNLYEVGLGVGYHTATMCIPTVINTLNKGRGMLVVPSETGFPGAAQEFILNNYVDREEAAETFLVQSEVSGPVTVVPEDVKIVPAKGQSFEEDVNLIESHRLELAERGPTTGLISFDTLEHRYGTDSVASYIGRYAAHMKIQRQVDMWLVRYTQKDLLDTLIPMANTHWSLDLVNGTLILRGILPDTGIYVVQPHLSRGYPEIELIPIE